MAQKPSRLKYHHETFEVLGIAVPAVSSASLFAIAALEQAIGDRLAESVREWYALEGATRLLRKYGIIDEPAQLDVPGRPLAPGLLCLTEEGFLYVGCTEQAICEFAVEMGGNDDPAVLIYCEGGDDQWRDESKRFSEFVLAGASMCRKPRPDSEC